MENSNLRTRRAFLTHLTAVGVASLACAPTCLASDSRGASDPASKVPLSELSMSDFGPYVGQTFIIRDDMRTFSAQLFKVQPGRGRSSSTALRPPFSVVFRIQGNESLPHRIYSVEHPSMGRYELFLGTVGKSTSTSSTLEAVFA